MIKPVVGKHKRLGIARRCCPRVWCVVDKSYDYLTALGEGFFSARPPLYCRVAQDGDHWVVFYGAYFREDVAHDHDFTGFQIIVPKGRPKGLDACAIFRQHWGFAFRKVPYGLSRQFAQVIFSAGSHTPDVLEDWRCQVVGSKETVIDYKFNLSMLDMFDLARDVGWDCIFAEIGDSVTAPWTWTSTDLNNRRRHLRRHFKINNVDGLFWDDPKKLWQIAEKFDLIKGM